MSRGHKPVLNVLQGAQATELTFHHDGKTTAQCLTLLHAEIQKERLKVILGPFEHTVISHGCCYMKKKVVVILYVFYNIL